MSDDDEHFGDHLGEEPGGRRVLPAGFADLPGGPELAAAVASVDVGECNGWELEDLIKAQRRLICWLEAQCLAAVNELTYAEPGMCDEPAERSVTPDPMTPEVLEPLLGWSGYRAHQYVFLAVTLPRLPRVREALASGGLELTEVRTIVDRITDAQPDLWDAIEDAIEDAIFPKVLELRGGLLRAKVEAEVLKADPEAALKRHRAARTGTERRDVARRRRRRRFGCARPLGRPGCRGVRLHRRHRPRGQIHRRLPHPQPTPRRRRRRPTHRHRPHHRLLHPQASQPDTRRDRAEPGRADQHPVRAGARRAGTGREGTAGALCRSPVPRPRPAQRRLRLQ